MMSHTHLAQLAVVAVNNQVRLNFFGRKKKTKLPSCHCSAPGQFLWLTSFSKVGLLYLLYLIVSPIVQPVFPLRDYYMEHCGKFVKNHLISFSLMFLGLIKFIVAVKVCKVL